MAVSSWPLGTRVPNGAGGLRRPSGQGSGTRIPKSFTAPAGDGMTADDDAWAMIADAAERALTLPGLSPSCAAKLARVMVAGDRAAGLPPRRAS